MGPPRDLRKHKVFWTWHRRVGIVAAVLVLVLSITGIALNHTDRLGLDARHIGWGWLLDWYGIEIPPDAVSYPLDPGRISLLGDRLYLDAQVLPGFVGELTGAVSFNGMVAAVVDGEVLLLTRAGDVVDRIGAENGLPPGIDAVGRAEDAPIVLRAGEAVYTTDDAMLVWSPGKSGAFGVTWSAASPLGDDMLETIRKDYRGRILPLERVLLDLHSGRIFGPLGPYLMDTAAVLLILLALTGSWLWLGRRAGR